MHPGATLFLDVCAQHDYWPDGAWPLVDAEHARNVATLFALAARLGVRQGGVCCAHGTGATASTSPAARGATLAPPHCVTATYGATRPPDCAPAQPLVVTVPGTVPPPSLDRAHAYYVASGCATAPDAEVIGRCIVDHLTAGVRDAVVYGAGLEHAIRYAVEALLSRRVRTHLVLDAAPAADDTEAQRLLAGWKFRGLDGATTAMIARLLTRAATP